MDNALQTQNPQLFNNCWPYYTLCNVPGFIDGWDAKCAWSTCDSSEEKVKELPTSSMYFEVTCSTPYQSYNCTLQRINDTGLQITMNTTLTHLEDTFGFFCDNADISSSVALEATRVYDKQLQILLFKFKQYRHNIDEESNKNIHYENLFKIFLTDEQRFNNNGPMTWNDGKEDTSGKNPFCHFVEYGLWKACADNNIISSAVHRQDTIYTNNTGVIGFTQEKKGTDYIFQNLQKDRTMIQAGTDRPAQMGQVAALYLEGLNNNGLNENLLIGHNSSTEDSYFYVLPRKIWGKLPENQAGGGKTIKNRRLKTIRKYKKVLKYKSYKKSSYANKSRRNKTIKKQKTYKKKKTKNNK